MTEQPPPQPSYDGPPAQAWPGAAPDGQYPQQPQGYPPPYQQAPPYQQYPQGPYPQGPYPQGPYPQGGYYQPPAMIQSLSGLASAIRILLGVGIVVYVLLAVGWLREYRLVSDLQDRPGSVSYGRANSADHYVQLMGALAALVFLATAIVFVIWFYRARQNAELYRSRPQQHGQGWAIGGWVCPILAWFFPYQMTNDIWLASELPTGAGYGQKHSVGLIKWWWAAWLVASISYSVAHFFVQHDGQESMSQLRFHAMASLLAWLATAVAGAMLAPVVARITKLQQARGQAAY